MVCALGSCESSPTTSVRSLPIMAQSPLRLSHLHQRLSQPLLRLLRQIPHPTRSKKSWMLLLRPHRVGLRCTLVFFSQIWSGSKAESQPKALRARKDKARPYNSTVRNLKPPTTLRPKRTRAYLDESAIAKQLGIGCKCKKACLKVLSIDSVLRERTRLQGDRTDSEINRFMANELAIRLKHNLHQFLVAGNVLCRKAFLFLTGISKARWSHIRSLAGLCPQVSDSKLCIRL